MRQNKEKTTRDKSGGSIFIYLRQRRRLAPPLVVERLECRHLASRRGGPGFESRQKLSFFFFCLYLTAFSLRMYTRPYELYKIIGRVLLTHQFVVLDLGRAHTCLWLSLPTSAMPPAAAVHSAESLCR